MRPITMAVHLLPVIVTLSALGSAASGDTIRVGAAISLKEALSEIVRAYQRESGETVELTFGSSGQIQQQIENGAAIDVFISAAGRHVDELASDGLADRGSRRNVAQNALVLIVSVEADDAPTTFAELADAKVTRLAIGEPRTVPAGQYAQQVLTALKLEDALIDRIIYGTNVRQVLAYVERGEVSAGIVYATDARQSGDKVKVVAIADTSTHEPIVYPAIVVSASRHKVAAGRFLEYLAAATAQQTLAAKGFVAPAREPATQPAGK